MLPNLLVTKSRRFFLYRFDKYVSDAANRFSYSGIDVVAFRAPLLEQWRKVVAISAEANIEENLIRRVEADLLNLMGNALPVSFEELEIMLNYSDAHSIVAAMLVLKAQPPEIRANVVSSLREMKGQKVNCL
ncbi:MAG: hypothetical protein Q7U63_20865 [Polaromonas sp.]|uniref:hypothetical protein n=1 Tax=Polaromonas sp. TaxID=1869339 RepID=UPI00271DA0C7|nr:hypothetical protein [Polaromonas sp.]MDO9116242.1 hypothetical protein [Polaromonas sp.]MDP1887087.1 hypothetical protein [Polaromonas sp.]